MALFLFFTIYITFLLQFHTVFVFDIKLNETGRYVWTNPNQNVQFFCAYCHRNIISDYKKYEHYHVDECYENNHKRLTEIEKENRRFPYCNRNGGEIPNCGAVSVIDGGSWSCQRGVSNDSVFVYTTCTLQCNLPNQLSNKQKSVTIRCNESLTFDEDVSRITCLEDQLSTNSVQSTIEITTPNFLKGCKLPQNLSGDSWDCDNSSIIQRELVSIGTSCWLNCSNESINTTTIICQENNMHANWSKNVLKISCNNLSHEGIGSQKSTVSNDLTVVIVVIVVAIPILVIISLVVMLCYKCRKRRSSSPSTSEENQSFIKSDITGNARSCMEVKAENSSTSHSTSNSSVNSRETSTIDSVEVISQGRTSKISTNDSMTGRVGIEEKKDGIIDSFFTDKPDTVVLPVDQLEMDKSAGNFCSSEILYSGSLGATKLDEIPLSHLSDISRGKTDYEKNPGAANLDSNNLDEMENHWDKESLTNGLINYKISTVDKRFQRNKNIPKIITESDGSEPKIAEKNHMIICEIGKEFKIRVTATGNPKPGIIWTLKTGDGKSRDVKPSTVSDSNTRNTAKLEQLFKCEKPTSKDMGAYKVTVSNKHGSSTAVYFVCHLDFCQQCNLPIENIESKSYKFIEELAGYIEPQDTITYAMSWKGLSRWIGVDNQYIKLKHFHAKGIEFKATKETLEILRQKGHNLAHLICYFSLEESLYIDVLKLIKKYFDDHCKTCSVCSVLLDIHDLS